MRRALAIVVLVSSCGFRGADFPALPGLSAALGDQPAPQRLDLRLSDDRWQALPAEIQQVLIGPDGRTWYQRASWIEPVAGSGGLADLKRHLAEEFPQPSPQIAGCEPLVFEPGGRAWFYAPQAAALLGYDGHQWIQHLIGADHDRPDGRCRTRGALDEGRAHRAAQGTVWIIGGHGVWRFDGQGWMYQPVPDPAVPGPAGAPVPAVPAGPHGVYLAVSPDGAWAAAHRQGTPSFSIFRNGEWKTRYVLPPVPRPAETRGFTSSDASPGPGPLAGYVPTALAIGAEPVLWYALADGALRQLPLDVAEPDADRMQGLVAALADDDYRTRQRATEQLRDLGPSIQSYLLAALHASRDLEQQTRLKWILRRLSAQEPPMVSLNGIRLGEIRRMFADEAGRLLLFVGMLDEGDGQTRPGLVILDAHRQPALVLRGTGAPGLWRMQHLGDGVPVLSGAGKQLWLPIRGKPEGAWLLDLDKKQFVDSLPQIEFNWLHAVAADGRVFVSQGPPQDSAGLVLLYTPGRKDQPPLRVIRTATAGPWFAVTDDGAVWAVRAGSGLMRFDGDHWSSIRLWEKGDPIVAIQPGHGGLMLAAAERMFLYRGDQELAAGSLHELLRQERTVVRQAFAPAPTTARFGGPDLPPFAVAADAAGNLWCLERGGLQVLIGDRWHDAREALAQAGAEQRLMNYLGPVGDGRSMYVRDVAGRSFIGVAGDGGIRFVRSPLTTGGAVLPGTVTASIRRPLRDREGALWIEGQDASGQVAYRLGTGGVIQEVRDSGWARLADPSGHVWLGEIHARGTPPDTFHLWRDGRIVHTLRITGVTDDRFLFSDRPGSVYARTVTGLDHFRADPSVPERYGLSERLPVRDAVGQVVAQAYSRLGFVAVAATLKSADAQDGRAESYVYLIELPKP